jgi:hypothetical protein
MIRAFGSSFNGSADDTSDVFADIADNTIVLYSSSTAIVEKNAHVYLGSGGALAMTLAQPTAGSDDGKILKIQASTTHAHTVTCTSGLNGGADSVLTFAAAGQLATLHAYNGYWYVDLADITGGTPGASGYSGATGSSGYSGFGYSGYSGATGSSGYSGKSGYSGL